MRKLVVQPVLILRAPRRAFAAMADGDSMTPKGLLNSDGNYAAQHQAMYDLLKYIQVGQSLPESLEAYEYRLRLNFLALVYFLWQQLAPLWEAYGKVSHTASSDLSLRHAYLR